MIDNGEIRIRFWEAAISGASAQPYHQQSISVRARIEQIAERSFKDYLVATGQDWEKIMGASYSEPTVSGPYIKTHTSTKLATI